MKYLLSLALVTLGCASCAGPIAPAKVHAKSPGNGPGIVLLNGNASDISDRVTAAFVSSTDYTVLEFTMHDDTSSEALATGIQQTKPALVVALGRRALDFALANLAGVPLVYALVVEDESHPIARDMTVGIGLNPSASTEFLMYELVLRDLHSVLSFYSPGKSDNLAHQSQSDLKGLGIDLTLLPYDTLVSDPNAAVKAVAGADAVWAFNDPGVMSSLGFSKLVAVTSTHNKPLLCSAFRDLAAVGATMVYSLDLENIGGQAASLATELIRRGKVLGAGGVRSPVGGHLVVNAVAAQKLGIEVPELAQPFISELIGKASRARR